MSQLNDDLLSTLMDAYFVVDEQRQLRDQSRSFIELAGVRKAAHCYEMVKLELCEKDCIALRALRQGRNVRINEIHGKAGDGRDVVFSGSATPVRDEAGNVNGVLVTYRDVTEETQVRDRLHQLEQRAKEDKDVLLRSLGEKTKELDEVREELAALKRRPGSKG